MTLQDFIDEEKARLAAFETYWKDEMAKGATAPDGRALYPDEMESGDWDDQYNSFEWDL